jgi:pilus assembly protein Flp/PilA
MKRLIAEFLSDRSGATAIEYALIAAGIAAVIIVTVGMLGTTVAGRYTAVKDALLEQGTP